jgi:heme O synthase-like polyprenyltransferase
MLPVLEPDGRSTARQSVVYAAALVPLSLAPTLMDMAGEIYFARRAGARARVSLADAAVRAHARRPRRAPRVLRIHRLPAGPVDPDDRDKI